MNHKALTINVFLYHEVDNSVKKCGKYRFRLKKTAFPHTHHDNITSFILCLNIVTSSS